MSRGGCGRGKWRPHCIGPSHTSKLVSKDDSVQCFVCHHGFGRFPPPPHFVMTECDTSVDECEESTGLSLTRSVAGARLPKQNPQFSTPQERLPSRALWEGRMFPAQVRGWCSLSGDSPRFCLSGGSPQLFVSLSKQMCCSFTCWVYGSSSSSSTSLFSAFFPLLWCPSCGMRTSQVIGGHASVAARPHTSSVTSKQVSMKIPLAHANALLFAHTLSQVAFTANS